MSIETGPGSDFRPSELVGSAVQRREDPRLVSGDAEYTDDVQYPRMAHLAIARSRHAHARVEGVDTAAAEAIEGVVAVYAAGDVGDLGIEGRLPPDDADHGVPIGQPVLADGHVTYQGQPIAAVLAEDRYAAHQAADAIDVTYERLDAVVDPVAAIEDEAPTIHEAAPDNVAFDWETGDEEAADEAISAAEHVLPVALEINRVLPTAMEPRGAVARFARSTGELSVEMSTQNPHTMRGALAAILGMPERKIDVRSPDVGGGFGAKLQPYTGYALAAWAAMEAGRPVKWAATRTEDCQSMVHSRHHVVEAEVGVNDDGTIQGFRADTVAPVGGYLAPGGAGVPTNLGVMANGQYAVPAAYVHTRGAFTNTTPLSAYRGAGRPEATYFVERLVRTVADALDLDPAEVRRRNFVAPEQFPYETGLGRTYDSGDYGATMDVALERVGYDAFRERQAAAREAGRFLGIGISSYVEACGAAPGWHEVGAVQLGPNGTAVVRSGTAEIGTGHQTAYAQIVASELGIPYDDVEVREGDTEQTVSGGGTAGSRAMPVGGSAVKESAADVREKAAAIAAHELEAAVEDLAFEDGEFAIRGAPERSIAIQEVAKAAYSPGDLPDDVEPGLEATSYYDPPNYTFPFGTHVAVVEVDPSSGDVDIERYVAVDDVGTQINPKIVEGQVHGGIVQGLGQALCEGVEYDDNGQLLTGSLQDYALPRAALVPEIEWDSTVTESPHNPLGVKGVGEAGAIAAPPAVVNAVVDALAPLGVDPADLDMPLTAETVWRAVQSAAQ
ncbi:MAG TPA: xanthine dehydrogenase family protein molybdopterin-binding subunit [Halobacteriales archaeon]|nr:xanthine dehydrogenase family protein molybdopterin-binding subunit [Halobacteriales archaeon]